MADIRYVVVADTKGATTSIKQLDGAIKEAADTAEKKAKPSFAGMWKQIAAGALIADVVKKTLGALTGFMKDAMKAAGDQEMAEKNLADALAVTGRNVDALMPKFKDFANAVQQQTVYTDDAVLSSMSLMAQLTDLDRRGLQEATQGAIGMASVFKTDLQSATTLVAKALAGNVGALSRYGIQVDKNLTMEEKRIEILRQLSLMYERAKGETNTFQGALSQLKNMWGEVQETVGNAIVKNESFRKGIKEVTEWVTKLSQSEDFKIWLNTIIDGLVQAVKMVGKFAKACKDLTDWLANVKGKNKDFEESQKTLNERLKEAAEKGLPFAIKALERMQRVTEEVKEETGKLNHVVTEAGPKIERMITETALGNARELTNVLADIGATITDTVLPPARDMSALLATISDEDMPGVSEAAQATTTTTRNYFDGLYNDLANGWARTIEGWMSGASTFRDFLKDIFGNIKDAFFKMIGEMIAEYTLKFIKTIFDSAKDVTDTITSTLKEGAKGIAGFFSGGIATGIGAAVGTFLGTVLTGGGGLGKTEGHWIHEIRDKAFDIHNWLISVGMNIEKHIVESRWELEAIKLNTNALQSVTAAQHGFAGVVRRPTMFLAGERGPERVTVTPNINVNPSFGNSKTTINIDGRAVAMAIAPYVPELSRMGAMKFHKNGLVEH